MFVDEHRDRFGVEPICKVLQFAPSTYYAVLKRRREPAQRTLTDAAALVEIQRVYAASNKLYGARKVWWQLTREGIVLARCTVEQLTRQNGLRGVVRGERLRTTIPGDEADLPGDLVDRNFEAAGPNVLWVADFTYVMTFSGTVYEPVSERRGGLVGGESGRMG